MSQLTLLDTPALEKTIKNANEAYRNTDSPIMSDAEYDAHTEELSKREPNHPYLNSVEAENDFGAGKVRHKHPMLSTDKLYTESDINGWVKRVKAAGGEYVTLTAKLDGMAGRYENGVLASRGDGSTGNDLTHMIGLNLKMIGGEGDGEIIIEQAYFDKYLSGTFMHSRNTVVGAVSSDELREELKQALEDGAIRFVNYNSLKSIRLGVNELAEKLDGARKEILADIEYLTDGIIIEVEGNEVREELGSTGHHHNWRVAAKEKGEAKETIVKSITYQVGRTGRVTPVLNIEPVELSGAVVSNITAHNIGYMKKHGLGVGAKISALRSGEVIPKHEKTMLEADVDIPEKCPCCNSKTEVKKDFLVCTNESCHDRLVASLNSFFEKLASIDLFGPVACDKLVSAGYNTATEIFSMDVDDFEKIGFGSGQAKNLKAELVESKNRAVDDFRILAAMGIEHLGRGDSKKLLKHRLLEDVSGMSKDELLAIDGFGDITATSISENMPLISDDLLFFTRYFENIIRTPMKTEVNTDSAIAGMNVVFTGKMTQGSRDDMKAQAESLGATCQSSVNKKTNLLIIGEKVGKAKLDKATSLGVKIIEEEAYLELIQ
ncbi:hypothetical protein A3715_10520 [Oleiphilus sp. HI0009]|nr:hypothetical protein A3715_10520 [Oleiphilus sp. HI0009]